MMHPRIPFQAVICLIEILVAFLLAIWISRIWARTPAPLLVRVARSPERLLLAIVFVVAPAVVTLFLNWPLMRLYQSASGAFLRMPISYLFAVLYGVGFGLGVCCDVAPAAPGARFRLGAALSVSAVLILAWHGMALLGMPLAFFFLDRLLLVVVVVVVARLIFREPANSAVLPDSVPPPLPARRSPALALLVGFAPSILALGTGVMTGMGYAPRHQTGEMLWAFCGLSVICCFASSISLFSRRTSAAAVAGLFLLLLNAFIAFGMGCAALFQY